MKIYTIEGANIDDVTIVTTVLRLKSSQDDDTKKKDPYRKVGVSCFNAASQGDWRSQALINAE